MKWSWYSASLENSLNSIENRRIFLMHSPYLVALFKPTRNLFPEAKQEREKLLTNRIRYCKTAWVLQTVALSSSET